MYKLFIFVVLLTGCASTISTPITITKIEQIQGIEGGPTCALRLQSHAGDIVWVTHSSDNCIYKVGDVLK